jgi:hypothetical protein
VAEIIPFDDLVRARRRGREQESARHCVQLIELNLRLAVEHFATAPADEQAVWARRIRVLGELLEYALRV